MHCAKGDFPHAQYAVCLYAIDARCAVKCGIEAVTWCDVMANHRRAAHSIPHFPFRILHAAVPHFTHSRDWSIRRRVFHRLPVAVVVAATGAVGSHACSYSFITRRTQHRTTKKG